MKDRVASTTSSSNGGGGGGGLQLLSPSLQQGLRATTTNYASYLSNNNNQLDDDLPQGPRKTAFDFDGFTLEAVRRRHAHEQPQPQPQAQQQQQRRYFHGGSFVHGASGSLATTAASSSGGSPRGSPSHSHTSNNYNHHANGARASTRLFPKASSYDRLDGLESSSSRSMDDYEYSHPSHQSRTNGSFMSSYSHSTSSRHQYLAHSASTASNRDTRNKRMSVASSTASSLHPGNQQQRTQVVIRGWLQRRRGRMIKRWKPQYCVLKTDHKLCLYANEDTVNGRLEGRFQLLRVTYNDKHGSFQMIGIGADETPYKEEFRPMDDDGWKFWFHALRIFFDAKSLRVALDRMPELSLVPGVDAGLLNEDDDEEEEGEGPYPHHGHFHHRQDDDAAQEVEEMIMRPYVYGGSVLASQTRDDRSTSTASNATASSANGSSTTSGGPGNGSSFPLASVAPVSGPVPAPSGRKTLMTNETRRASIEQILTAAANGHQQQQHNNNNQQKHQQQRDDDHHHPQRPPQAPQPQPQTRGYLSSDAARASQRAMWSSGKTAPVDVNGGDRSHQAPRTAGAAAAAGEEQSLHKYDNGGAMPRRASRAMDVPKATSVVHQDCPMIERNSQNLPMPILEGSGSESVLSHSDDGLSWNH